MTAARSDVDVLAGAALGTALYVTGHGPQRAHDWPARLRALRSAAVRVPDGPLAGVIADAADRLAGATATASPAEGAGHDELVATGAELVCQVLPVLVVHTPTGARQVRHWLLRIALAVAATGASPDITVAEQQAVDELDRLMTRG